MQKRAVILAVCTILLFCIVAAGCAGNSYSPTPTPTPTPKPTSTPANLSVLFFYKPECPFCQRLENTTSFQQLQKKATVQWIVSNQSIRTDEYEVTGVPTLILLNHGTEVGRWVDPADASAINAKINSLLAAG